MIIKELVIKMETIREVVNSNILTQLFNIPATLRNRNVEVIIKLASDKKDDAPTRKSARGRLSRYANPELQHMEKGAWGMAVGEKHADS